MRGRAGAGGRRRLLARRPADGGHGREFDFRAKTLVRKTWGKWIDGLVEKADANIVPWIRKYWKQDREPKGAEALAEWPSNAQGAAERRGRMAACR